MIVDHEMAIRTQSLDHYLSIWYVRADIVTYSLIRVDIEHLNEVGHVLCFWRKWVISKGQKTFNPAGPQSIWAWEDDCARPFSHSGLGLEQLGSDPDALLGWGRGASWVKLQFWAGLGPPRLARSGAGG